MATLPDLTPEPRLELAVLEAVTLADLAAGHLPDSVRALTWGAALA